jgi:hypothetical protein
MPETIKDEMETRLTEIDLHLASAEKACREGNPTLAEAEVFAARDKVRHTKAIASQIAN